MNTYFVQVRANSGRVRQRRVVDDDLEVAVRAALVLERVFDLGYRALKRREVIFAHRGRGVGIQYRLGVLEAHRRPGVDGEALN